MSHIRGDSEDLYGKSLRKFFEAAQFGIHEAQYAEHIALCPVRVSAANYSTVEGPV